MALPRPQKSLASVSYDFFLTVDMASNYPVCKFLGTRVGCFYGANCRFYHDKPEPGFAVLSNLSGTVATIDTTQATGELKSQGPGILDRKGIANFN